MAEPEPSQRQLADITTRFHALSGQEAAIHYERGEIIAEVLSDSARFGVSSIHEEVHPVGVEKQKAT